MKSLGIHDQSFRLALGFVEALPRGGQELILPEILALLIQADARSLWLPFSLGPLARVARTHPQHPMAVHEQRQVPSVPFDALYFGTPTIVDGGALFPEIEAKPWTKQLERLTVRDLCKTADLASQCRIIVAGLGSGDILEMERHSDMVLPGWSPPRLVAWKDFGDFKDSLFMTYRLELASSTASVSTPEPDKPFVEALPQRAKT